MSGLICPKCGRSEGEVRFIEAFCADCYPVSLKLPQKLAIMQCTRCMRLHIQGRWVEYSAKRVADFVLSKCRGDYDSAEYDPERGAATFVMGRSGARVEREIPLDIQKTICQQCSRLSGGYYEAIIQLRGAPTKVLGYSEMLYKKLAGRTFIAKEDEKENGVDIYVGSSKAVVEIVAGLGIKSLITKKLVGAEQGKRLYRTTFLIRL